MFYFYFKKGTAAVIEKETFSLNQIYLTEVIQLEQHLKLI